MFETVAILIVFFILVSLGFIFYSSISRSMISQEAQERIELEGIQTAQRLTYLPEMKCTSSIAKEIGSCIDYYKIKSFADMNSNPDPMISPRVYYYDILGFSTITVRTLYPEEEEIIVYDYPKPNYISKAVYQIPVVLLEEGVKNSRCGPEFSNAKCSFAFLEIGVYS